MRPRSGCALDLKDSRGCDDMIAAIFRRRRMRASCRRLRHRGWRKQRYVKDIHLTRRPEGSAGVSARRGVVSD